MHYALCTIHYTPHCTETSMINCNRYASLEACADAVVDVAGSEERYVQLLSAPVLVGRGAVDRRAMWDGLFGWQGGVGGEGGEGGRELLSLRVQRALLGRQG